LSPASGPLFGWSKRKGGHGLAKGRKASVGEFLKKKIYKKKQRGMIKREMPRKHAPRDLYFGCNPALTKGETSAGHEPKKYHAFSQKEELYKVMDENKNLSG